MLVSGDETALRSPLADETASLETEELELVEDSEEELEILAPRSLRRWTEETASPETLELIGR